MAVATERILVGCGGRGDAISIGWKTAANRGPVTECIETLGKGKALKVAMAFETTGKMSYDYLWKATSSCPEAHLGRGFMRLECMEGGILAAELLQPVYDLCARLSAPRIWYDLSAPTFPKGEYCIEEARAVLSPENSDRSFGSWNRRLVGVYYPGYAKVLSLIEELTKPETGAQEDIGGMLHIRRMLNVDAFYISQNTKRSNKDAGWELRQKWMDEDWRLAQERMAARAIWHMKNSPPGAKTSQDRWLGISGPLEVPDAHSSIEELGMLDRANRQDLLIPLLDRLKKDDSIHLVKAGIPLWLYLDGEMAWKNHRPGDD